MFKQKLAGALLAGTILAASAGLLWEGKSVSAAPVLQLDSENASLFLPETYEQYLTLTSPSDIAVSERYVAIAEEDKLYLFDREEGTPAYHTYEHTAAQSKALISKIQFSDEGKLYFSDNLLGFYELDLSDLDSLAPATEQRLTSLSTFYLEKDTIFEASVVSGKTTYLSAALSSPDTQTQFGQDDNTVTPQLGFSDGKFYTAVGSVVTMYSISSEDGKYIPTGNFTLQPGLSGLKAITVTDGAMYYSVNGSSDVANGLYRYNLATHNYELLLAGDGYGALTSYDGKLYAVKGNAVMEYSLENGIEKTDYEISSASDSVNRLNAATDCARAGDLLVTADSGNRRLSVYDMKKDVYTVLPLSYAPAFVATDGEIIAAAADTTVYVYAWNSRAENYELVCQNTVANTISGIACLYGKCYFVTHGFGYGIAGAEGPEFLTRDSGLDQFPPAALTNDLYGNLYVIRSDGSVLRYTESNFVDPSVSQGEALNFTLPKDFHSVRADFEGDIFCLDGTNVFYRNGVAAAQIDGGNFIFTDGSVAPVSFALGFEDDRVYFNFGNFVVRSEQGVLGFPTLATIDATGVHEEISRVHTPEEVTYASVRKGAVGIKVDLASLESGAPYFPYDSYARTAESGRGVILAETAKYELVALYHDRGYDVRLFRREQCESAEAEIAESAGKKNLSSACNLYNYPCIADAYAVSLPRGTELRVLYTVVSDGDKADLPDYGYDFVYVEVQTPARETLRGYVPLSFLTDADPNGREREQFEIVKLKEDTLFGGPNGEITLAAGTEVRLYREEDGTYTARYSDESGKTYFRSLTEEMIDRGQSDALRIALIVILSVLALVIIGVYFALLPREKKRKNS